MSPATITILALAASALGFAIALWPRHREPSIDPPRPPRKGAAR